MKHFMSRETFGARGSGLDMGGIPHSISGFVYVHKILFNMTDKSDINSLFLAYL
jgi:hypothetical protein